VPDLKQRPKISILITCYNLEAYIGEAIQSLLDQDTSDSFEIVVIDDASTDKSREVIKGFRDPRLVTIFLDKNVGAAQAINIAYARLQGEYVCRFDGDDRWTTGYLRKAAAILDADPEVVLVHSDVAFIDSAGKVTSASRNIARPAALAPTDFEFEALLEKYYMNAPTIMARKSAWQLVLPWPEIFKGGLGDWFCALGITRNHRSHFIDEPLAFYRIHNTNMHRAMIANGLGEKNTFIVLDHFLKDEKAVDDSKARLIYFRHLKDLGFAYFSINMIEDARRVLSRAMTLQPLAAMRPDFLRIYVATLIGKSTYEKFKAVIKRSS
jgi:glycosyltransferase involved in cell wall biosynthesis